MGSLLDLPMAPSKKPSPQVGTLDELLDRVSNAREELVAVERTLERLRSEHRQNPEA